MRGKPFGATGANVYSFVGADAPTDPHIYHYEGLATRGTTQVLFPDTVASGQPCGSAHNRSAQARLSAGSTPISTNLPGGSVGGAA